jgi:NAD(P)-dependent dehydrogenase (short-subunit alcohol dehydrogenase family)
MTTSVLIVGNGVLGDALRTRLLQRANVAVRVASRSSEVKLDITSQESVKSLDEQLGAASLDHVVVCCGASTFGQFSNFDADAWSANLSSKLVAVSQLSLALVKDLKVLKDGGSITITTGQTADVVNKMWPGLAVNCAGLNAFVKNAGIDMPRGVRLNAVSPSQVTESALKAGMPTEGTVSAADAAVVYESLIFSEDTAIVKNAGVQAVFKRKEEGLAKTSDL